MSPQSSATALAVASASSLCLALSLVGLPLAGAARHSAIPALSDADVGNWTVGNCILAQFAMEFVIWPNATKPNDTMVVKVPVEARADADQDNCQVNMNQLSLNWRVTAPNDTEVALERNFTVVFARSNDTSIPSYGVKRMYGRFELAHFKQADPKTNQTLNVTSYLTVDSGDKAADKLAFRVPVNRTFLCADVGDLTLPTFVHYTLPGYPDQGHKLPNNTRVETRHVMFNAFRPTSAPPRQYQSPMDCDFQPNDVVPIAVGVALAALIVGVLVAYMWGRRRQRQMGYQSV